MQVVLYELKTHKALELIENVAAITIETVASEIQVLNIRDAEGNTRGKEIDASLIGIHIVQQ